AVALPDFNVALKHNPSGRIYGLPRILWHARRIARCRILLLGTLKEYRMTGVDALMYHWIWTKGLEHGYHWGEGGWILEDKAPMGSSTWRAASAPAIRTNSCAPTATARPTCSRPRRRTRRGASSWCRPLPPPGRRCGDNRSTRLVPRRRSRPTARASSRPRCWGERC